MAEDVARGADCDNVRVIVEHLEHDRTVRLALRVLVHLQLGQHASLKLLPRHGIGLRIKLLIQDQFYIPAFTFTLYFFMYGTMCTRSKTFPSLSA